MKIAGIIGGIGPEATMEYYRRLVALYRAKTADGSYPPVVINSIDMQKVLGLVGAKRLPELIDYLLTEIDRLARAGAEFAALAANTPHIVFPALRERAKLPLLSIIEVTCAAAQTRGLKRLGLFGTRFTMQGRFYPDVFETAGVSLISPNAADQDYIHEKYMGELVKGIILPETRQRLLEIIDRMEQQAQIQGLILGGTELPLILSANDSPRVPLLDTTQLHVEAIVERMLG